MKIIERIKAWLDAPVEVCDPSKPQVVSVVDHGRSDPNG